MLLNHLSLGQSPYGYFPAPTAQARDKGVQPAVRSDGCVLVTAFTQTAFAAFATLDSPRRPIRERSNQTRTNHAIPPGPVSPCCADLCLPWDGSRPFAVKLSRHPFGAICVWAQLGLRGPRGCRWMVFFARHREMQTFSATKRGGYVWFIRHTTRGAGSRTLPASILLDGPAVIHPSEPGRSTPQFTPNLGARPAV